MPQQGPDGTLQLNPDGFVLLEYPMKTLFVLLTALLATTATARPPNVVVIFIDDMGYADIGPFGGNSALTPHLNQLAADGRKFTNFYVSQAVCSASQRYRHWGQDFAGYTFRAALDPIPDRHLIIIDGGGAVAFH